MRWKEFQARSLLILSTTMFFVSTAIGAESSKYAQGVDAKTCQDEAKSAYTKIVDGNLYLDPNQSQPFSQVALATTFRLKPYADSLLKAAGLLIPERVNVIPHRSLGLGIFWFDRDEIHLTIISASDPNWFKLYSDPDERITGPSFLHEYAHAVFWNSLTKVKVPWPQLKAIGQHTYCESLAVDSAESQKAYVDADNRELSVHVNGSPLAIYGLYKVIVPYTEFYSDLVAALSYNNPSVIDVPVNAYKPVDQTSRNRDFALDPIVAPETDGNYDEHEILAKSRHALWLMAWKNRTLSEKDKVRILKKVFAIFSADIEMRWKNGIQDENLDELNQRIIGAFQQEMGQNP